MFQQVAGVALGCHPPRKVTSLKTDRENFRECISFQHHGSCTINHNASILTSSNMQKFKSVVDRALTQM